MDDIVLRGMAKWPNVPSVYGWLALDRRGNWLIKGERIANAVVSAFIGRNYEHDVDGRWFFQNGPQRVYVALDYTPLVYRFSEGGSAADAPRLECHTGRRVDRIEGAWIDEAGGLLLLTEHGIGIVHDRDLERLLACFTDARGSPLDEERLGAGIEALQRGADSALWFRYRGHAVPVAAIASTDVAGRFGFVQRPVPPAGQEECY